MSKENQQGLQDNERQELIRCLEAIGRKVWQQDWQANMALPNDLLEDREGIIRFLLLRTLLNQQGDTGKVKQLAQELFSKFGKDVLYNPVAIEQRFDEALEVFKQIGGERGAKIYRVGALGGIKPLSLFLYRFPAFVFFLHRQKGGLYEIVKNKLANEDVLALWAFFRDDPKAARMLTNWIVWLFKEVWHEPVKTSLEDTLMVVDGHVGKVFCRTGALEKVVYERRRQFIIMAKELRKPIEKLVKTVSQAIPMFVDEGAFHVAMSWCHDTKPRCNSCPLRPFYLAGQGSEAHIRWTAYQV